MPPRRRGSRWPNALWRYCISYYDDEETTWEKVQRRLDDLAHEPNHESERWEMAEEFGLHDGKPGDQSTVPSLRTIGRHVRKTLDRQGLLAADDQSPGLPGPVPFPKEVDRNRVAADATDMLVDQWLRIGNTKAAIATLREAAQQASECNDYEEQGTRLTEAIELAEEVEDSELLRLHLYMDLGRFHSTRSGFASPETKSAYDGALKLCKQIGNSPILLPALYGIWGFHLVSADLRKALELAENCLDIASTPPDSSLLMPAHSVLGSTWFRLGELQIARENMEIAVDHFDSMGYQEHLNLYSPNPIVACLSDLGWNLWILGFPDQALRRTGEAIALAKQLSDPFSTAFALFFATVVSHCRRDVSDVEDQANELARLCEEHGFQWAGPADIFVGWAMTETGRSEAGLKMMTEGLTRWQRTGAQTGTAHAHTLLAEAHGKAGFRQEGLKYCKVALAYVDENGERQWEAEIHRVQGELLDQRRSPAEAEEKYLESVTIARRQGAKSLELRAAISFSSHIMGDQDKRKQAKDVLANAYDWFTEGRDTTDLIAAKTLTSELEE